MSQMMKISRSPGTNVLAIDKGAVGSNPNGVVDLGTCWKLPDHINNGVPIPKKFFNEEGELDLRRATGNEAAAYLRGLGMKIAPAIRV
jgi:hypothetical protein